ncbi:5412_t:CDS:2, partial [Funneliformis caledonium]
YEEFDGRQSLMASVARVVTLPSSLKWSRTDSTAVIANVVTHEKDRLASALFSGVEINEGMNSSIYGHSVLVEAVISPNIIPGKACNNRGPLLMNSKYIS